MMLPSVQRDAHLSTGQLTAYYKQVRAAKPDAATVTPSGNVATVELRAKSGDLAVIVSLGDQGHTSLAAGEVRTLADTLAGQAGWPAA